MTGESPMKIHRILIIDDEQVVIDACTEILDGESVRISSARESVHGLRMCRDYRPDLVLLDLKMPGLSGFEVLERIREGDPTVVVVVITGYATVASAVEAMKQGAYDFLPKPFTPDQLRLTVRRALEKRSLVLEMVALRREKEALRENFAAIVAHELKAPLGAVLQNLFVLERQLAEVATAEQRERLERMKERLGGLVGMVDTWLQGVKVDLDRVRDKFVTVELSGPVDDAVENIRGHATRKEVEITVDVESPCPAVAGDRAILAEAVTNLLGNAVKYSHPGAAVSVRVATRGGEAVVEVEDHGIGISSADLARVFDDFYRAGTWSGAEEGAGIGLSVARRIVAAHGGLIEVESEVGRGSTFRVRIPTVGEAGGGGPTADDAGGDDGKERP